METEIVENARFIAVECGNNDNVVARGDDAKDVIKRARKSGIDFIFIPEKDYTFFDYETSLKLSQGGKININFNL